MAKTQRSYKYKTLKQNLPRSKSHKIAHTQTHKDTQNIKLGNLKPRNKGPAACNTDIKLKPPFNKIALQRLPFDGGIFGSS